jgi:hypothetical protein
MKHPLWCRDCAINPEISREVAPAVLNKSIEHKDGIPKPYLKSLSKGLGHSWRNLRATFTYYTPRQGGSYLRARREL